ncbi:hypothetical protein BDN72DRAFT_863867 [Pluteus cervinus]|uniref:Uncharacterized protein n=1 Tax=Pluteus cervinus TaxID=181527 RepID=A0ACD3A5Z0_9AGAR|nr:hypothetical protein BDN72DRAFT_863867 [Pluteus cervinus]
MAAFNPSSVQAQDPTVPIKPFAHYQFCLHWYPCTPGGSLGFGQGAGSNKCERGSGFYISSDVENAQLGAELVLDGRLIYYKSQPNEDPPNCVPVQLWTILVSS